MPSRRLNPYNPTLNRAAQVIPYVSPGYDDRKMRGVDRPSVPRSQGAQYLWSWLEMRWFVKCQPRVTGKQPLLMINSFNEWHEGTQAARTLLSYPLLHCLSASFLVYPTIPHPLLPLPVFSLLQSLLPSRTPLARMNVNRERPSMFPRHTMGLIGLFFVTYWWLHPNSDRAEHGTLRLIHPLDAAHQASPRLRPGQRL